MRDIGRRVSRRPWIQTLIYGLLWVLATFVISLAVRHLRRFRARTPVRARDADVRRLVRRCAEVADGLRDHRAGRHRADLRRRAPRRRSLVGVGQRRRVRVHPVRADAGAGVRRSAVQRLQAAARRRRARGRAVARAREPDPDRQRRRVRRVAPDHAHQRERVRLPRHHARRAQRQPAQQELAARNQGRAWATRWGTTCSITDCA